MISNKHKYVAFIQNALRQEAAISYVFFLFLAYRTFHMLNRYAVDAPYWDEWSLISGVGAPFSFDWIFGNHNEHRIVLTRLTAWLQYHADGLNFRHTIFFNFGIYFCYVFLLWKNSISNFWGKLMFPLYAWSNLPNENTTWGFQNCYLFFVLCSLGAFFLARIDSTSTQRWMRWFAPIVAVLGVYSFGAGVIGASVLVCLWLTEGYIAKSERIRLWTSSALVILGIFSWLLGYKTVKDHPSQVYFWQPEFWQYYANIISSAFGYDKSLNLIPGFVVLFIVIVSSWKVIRMKRPKDASEASIWPAFIGLACLAFIAFGRAGLSIDQSKVSRYTTVGLMIIPFILNKFERFVVSLNLNSKARIFAFLALTILFTAPLSDCFRFRKNYKRIFSDRSAGLACIHNFYTLGSDGLCTTLYPIPMPALLDEAKRKNIHFVGSL